MISALLVLAVLVLLVATDVNTDSSDRPRQ